jgi:PKD repeat protein
MVVLFTKNSPTDRETFERFLNNHPYTQFNGMTETDLEGIPKADRPDLAHMQNFLMTMDPNLGYPPVERLNSIYLRVKELKKMKSGIPGDGIYDWVERGPNNVAGRVRALVFDPNDGGNTKVWAGGVSGGLWYNNNITDANSSWNGIDDFWDNLAINSIAFDPSNTQVMYVGTGEGWYNADAVRGAGIWVSSNGGVDWSQLSSTDNSSFTTVQKIVVTSTGRVLAATNDGIFVSDNNGASWTNNLSGFIADLEIAPDGTTLYAGKGRNGTTGAVYKSVDSGDNWSSITPSGAVQERVELAIAPSNGSVIYAVASNGDNVSWFKKSTDGGTNWTDITIPKYMTQSCTLSAEDDFARGQAWYDLILAVHPTNPDILLAGGIDVNKSTDGGSTWSTITYWTGKCAPYSHADQHAIIFRPGSPNEVIVGSDGGVSYSSNAGSSSSPSFTIMNKGFNITQFYSATIHPDARKNYFLGGTQDNGTQRFKYEGINATDEPTGGDGGFSFIDQKNPNIQITSYVYNNYYISRDGGASFTTLQSSNDGRFINPSAYDNNLHILYSAKNSSSLNRITNIEGSPTIGSISIKDLGATASHIKVSPYTANTTTLFVGTGAGKVFKITNAQGNSPGISEVTGASFPSGNVSCIEIGADENELLVTFSNYGVNSVWYTDNGGTSWVSKEGDLPDMPVRWALFNPNDRTQVILATEVGVWSTSNLGNSSPNWVASTSGLANVRTDMLILRESDYEVIAATHGRGFFTSNGFSNIDPSVLGAYFSVDGKTTIYKGGSVSFEDLSTGTPTSWSWTFEGGTPSTSSLQNPTVTYETAGIYQVSLTVGDGVGTESTTRTNYITVNETGDWTEQAVGFATSSLQVDFIDVINNNTVWAISSDGSQEFARTVNGGTSWSGGSMNIVGDLRPAMIDAINSDTAWVPLFPNSAGADGGIYVTYDGGANWSEQASAGFDGASAFANVVYFWNKDEGFCMGDPNGGYFEIYTTSNGGVNWSRVARANIPNPSASDEYGTIGQFTVGDDGVVFFNTTKGRIYKSTDKGANWTVITTPLTGYMRCAFADENKGFICDAQNSSNAYYTVDGGANWISIIDGNDLRTAAVRYVPGTERMYVSSGYGSNSGASYSVDGGKKWHSFEGTDGIEGFSLGFYDMTLGWMGNSNSSPTSGGIFKYMGGTTIPEFGVDPVSPKMSEAATFTDMTISNETGLTYSWDFGVDATPATANTAGPHSVTYSTSGTKTVTLTVNGKVVTGNINVLSTTGIDDETIKQGFAVYP